VVREIEARRGWLERFAECFVDHREASRVEHAISVLVKQRILGIVAGYEDVNDHETLRDDALLALACGQEDLVGERRPRERDRGHALAGKSTLNRLEHAVVEERPSRYRRVALDPAAIEGQFVDCMIEAHDDVPERIVLDLDATDDPVHGHQEGRFFHGYYRSYCYLPLYIFCGDHLLCAKLRPANQDGAAGSVEEVARIVDQIRSHWPEVEIWIRADSGFAREALMAWCEANRVHYVLGLAKNARLNRAIGEALEAVRREQEATGMAARRYRELRYRTKKTWNRERRVVAKAEQLPGKTPDQGAAAGSVRRPDQHGHDGGQPTTPLVRLDGLRARGGTPPPRPQGHVAGERPGGHDPNPAAEDRRLGQDQRPARLRLAQQRPPSPARLRPGHPSTPSRARLNGGRSGRGTTGDVCPQAANRNLETPRLRRSRPHRPPDPQWVSLDIPKTTDLPSQITAGETCGLAHSSRETGQELRSL
jgi:hypothetical protein